MASSVWLRRLRQIDARLRGVAGKRWGHVALLLLAAAGWSVLWAAFDIAVVRMAFPPPLTPGSNTYAYWTATWGFLFPLATLLAFREHAWLPLLAVIAGAWEDIAFYWILLLPVPPGVAASFYIRAAVFLAAAVVGELASHRLPTRARIVVMAGLVVAYAFFNVLWCALTVAAILIYVTLRRLSDLLRTTGEDWRGSTRTPKAP